MLRSLLGPVVLLLLLSGPAGGAVPDHLRRAVAVIGLHNAQEGKVIRLGTAFHVGGGLFYTNAHVVLAQQRIQREESPDYNQWLLIGADPFGNPVVRLGTAEVRCIDRRYAPNLFGDPEPHDVALVRYLGPESRLPPSMATSAERVAVGERIRVIGFPATSVLVEMRGEVTQVHPDRIIARRDSGTAILHGSSGSPMLNAHDRVIGILQAGNIGHLQARAVPIQAALAGCPL